MQLTALTFVVEKLHLSTRRTTHRKFLDVFISDVDSLNNELAIVLLIKSK